VNAGHTIRAYSLIEQGRLSAHFCQIGRRAAPGDTVQAALA
jgi:hypothetical protein